MKRPLPDWLTQVKRNWFVIDPDIIMPEILGELGVKEVDRYWLHIARGIMRLDAHLALKLSGLVDPDNSVTIQTRADGGRKARWNFSMYPAGTPLPATLIERTKLVRTYYRQIRGFVPS